MTALAILTLLTTTPTPHADEIVDEVPLIAPIVPPISRSQPSPKPLRERGFHLGPKGLAMVLSRDVRLATGGAVEFGYRLPFAGRRLGLLFEPGLVALFSSAPTPLGWCATLLAAISYHEPLGAGLLRLTAGATLDIGSTVAPGAATAHDFATLGAASGVGYVLGAGPGGFVVELRYRLYVYVLDTGQVLSHGGSASVGYSFFL